MEILLKKLNNLLPKDKLLHFFYGSIIYIILLIGCSFQVGIKLGSLYSLLGISVIAGLKETYDYFNKNKHIADIKDFLFTVSAGIVFTAILQLA